MAEFSKLVITDKGQALIAKMIAGTGNIEFTKIAASSHTYTEGQLQALTALADVKQTSLISKVTRTNNVVSNLFPLTYEYEEKRRLLCQIRIQNTR